MTLRRDGLIAARQALSERGSLSEPGGGALPPGPAILGSAGAPQEPAGAFKGPGTGRELSCLSRAEPGVLFCEAAPARCTDHCLEPDGGPSGGAVVHWTGRETADCGETISKWRHRDAMFFFTIMHWCHGGGWGRCALETLDIGKPDTQQLLS